MTFKSINPSEIVIKNNIIKILALPGTNFFSKSLKNDNFSAPFYYFDMATDFVVTVKVSLDFEDICDEAGIMIMKDVDVWAKLSLELTDANSKSILSIVHNNRFNESNYYKINNDFVWLQICRVDCFFMFSYSLDKVNFSMLTHFNLDVENNIKVGLIGQSPKGSGGVAIFENLEIERRKNITQ